MDKLSREIIERIAKEFHLRPDDPQVLQIAYKALWEVATGHPAEQAERDPHPLLPSEDDPARRVPDRQDLTELVDSILDDPQPRTAYLARPLPLAVTSLTTGVWLKDLVRELRDAPPGSSKAAERAEYRTPTDLPLAGPHEPTVQMPPPVALPAREEVGMEAAPKPSREMPWATPPIPPGARRLGPRYVPRSEAAAHARGDRTPREGALPEQAAKSAPAWLLAGTAHFVIAIVLMNIVYFTTRDRNPGVFRVTLSTPLAAAAAEIPAKPAKPEEDVRPPVNPNEGPSGDPDGKGNQDSGLKGNEDEGHGPAGTEIPDREPGNAGTPGGPGEIVADSTDVKIGVGDGATPGDGGSGARGPGGPYSGRGGDARKTRLRRYGGGDDTEEAVALGLKWLAAHQLSSGNWGGMYDGSRCPLGDACTAVDSALPMTTTALALLAFAGAGYSHFDQHDTPYQATVERGLKWLLRCQQESGQFVDPGSSTLYVHAIATMAAAELLGLTKDPALVEPVRKATACIVEAQQKDGGWDYETTRTNRLDASVSGWQVMALRCARAAGIEVPEKTIKGAGDYYRRATDRTKVAVAYEMSGPIWKAGSLLILASGSLSAAFVGVRDEAYMAKATERIAAHGPQLGEGSGLETPWLASWYWTYTGTLYMFYRGGSAWNSWNKDMKKLVLGSQEKKSHLKGSWPPVNGEIGYGGRSYSTAMACINLEVYYRYLPSYSMPLPSAEPAAGSAAIPPAMATPEELVESLKAKDMMVRRGAFKELVHRRDASSVPALIEATRAETTSARPLMIEDLGAFDGNEAVLEALVAFAKDDDARSREAAFRALKKATGEPFRTADEWAAWWAARKK